MAQNKEIVADNTEILTKISKRLDNVTKNHNKMTVKNKNNNESKIKQHKQQKQEINQIKSQIEEIDKEIIQLRKITFKAGNKLKRKVSKDEIEYLEEELNKWKLEEYIRRDELKKTYKHYDRNSKIF